MKEIKLNSFVVATAVLAFLSICLCGTPAETIPINEGQWTGASVVNIQSTLDATQQPCMFYTPTGSDPVPLLVGLHSWGGSYDQAEEASYLTQCKTRGWVLVHPHFRGPNTNPNACASDLAVQDILDAVQYAKEHAQIDVKRIYLMGISGGGSVGMGGYF